MIVISDQPTFPGCLIEVRPVGVLIMRDDMGLDHKVLGVPVSDPRLRHINKLRHMPSHVLAEIDYFFTIYKDLEGKHSDTYGWEGHERAESVIKECMDRYIEYTAGRIGRFGEPVA